MKELVVGKYSLLLATKEEDLKSMYELRYKDLILNYYPNKESDTGLDKDEYDDVCDHLIVKDNEINQVVGTYRLIKKEHLINLPFLTETEFNIDKLKNSNSSIVEIGRAVIHKDYRDGFVLRMLLRGIFDYCKENNIRYLFGTASFHGNNIDDYLNEFAYLSKNYLSNNDILAISPTHPFSSLNFQDNQNSNIELPTLIKAYLKMGATIGDGVYVDKDFNSIDTFILLDLNNKNDHYVERITTL